MFDTVDRGISGRAHDDVQSSLLEIRADIRRKEYPLGLESREICTPAMVDRPFEPPFPARLNELFGVVSVPG